MPRKQTAISLDAKRWSREGILRAGIEKTGTWQWTYRSGTSFWLDYTVDTLDRTRPTVRLWYTGVLRSTKQEGSEDYTFRLTTTQPHFGGLRWWFICPLIVSDRTCQRRVSKLYLPQDGRYFGCRHCYDLTYTSCQESPKYDSLYRHIGESTGFDIATVRRALNRRGKER